MPKVLSLAFPDLPVKYNRSDYFIEFPNGSEYWVAGLDDHKRAEKILGKEYSTMHFNEISELDFSSVQIALTRLAEKNELKKRVLYDMNPPPKNHWAYLQFIKKLNPTDKEPIETPDNYASLLMNPIDNLENLDEDYLSMLKSLPQKERDRFLNGLFADVDDGSVYHAFNREEHVKETIRTPGTLLIGMDFNVDPMTAVIGQFYDNTFYIHDEVFLTNSDTFKMADVLVREGNVGDVIPDSTGKNRRTSGHSDHEILRRNGFKVLETYNPYVTDRVNNVNRLFTEKRIIINPKCKKLINDLELVAWKDNELDQRSDKMLTHISDALGYLLYKIEPIGEKRKTQRTVLL